MTADRTTPWRLDRSHARLRFGTLAAELDPAHPERGLVNLKLNNTRVPASLLRLRMLTANHSVTQATEIIGEQYIRGTDLVATYSQQPSRPMRTQAYWRALPDIQGMAALELIVSVQTSLWNSDPHLAVESHLQQVSDVLVLDSARQRWVTVGDLTQHSSGATGGQTKGTAVMVRLSNELSYLEAIYPSDYCNVAVQKISDGVGLRWDLFRERLEKGVIRRGRVRAVFLASADDEQTAGECVRQFVASPPPLTT